MNDAVTTTLARLEQAAWFERTGLRDLERAEYAASWDEALRLWAGDGWQNILIEAANGISERLLVADKERFCAWNGTVRALKELILPLVESRTVKLMAERGLGKEFRGAVNWDLLHVLLEAEHSDLVKPGFYAAQAFYYVSGHFPCGWNGSVPQGSIVVY